MAEQIELTLQVNGTSHCKTVEVRRRLADFLREDLRLTGTHIACEQGACGACTVLVDDVPRLSCITLAAQVDGSRIHTVESLAEGGSLSILQSCFQQEHALQCGYCTPGFLMALTGLLETNPEASDEEIEEVIDGLICRCTGYLPILKAAQSARDQTKQLLSSGRTMQLQHQFKLPSSARATWDLLNRVEEITPCLPGAQATFAGDNRYDILMKIRFGPLDLAFKGQVEIVERDAEAHKLVIKTKANDAKGQGSANATTVATLSESAGMTLVVLDTELAIGGRIAQMGRGMVGDVSNELLDRFVANLKAKFLSGAAPAVAAPGANASSSTSPATASAADEYVDVGGAVRRAAWRRVLNLLFFWRKA